MSGWQQFGFYTALFICTMTVLVATNSSTDDILEAIQQNEGRLDVSHARFERSAEQIDATIREHQVWLDQATVVKGELEEARNRAHALELQVATLTATLGRDLANPGFGLRLGDRPRGGSSKLASVEAVMEQLQAHNPELWAFTRQLSHNPGAVRASGEYVSASLKDGNLAGAIDYAALAEDIGLGLRLRESLNESDINEVQAVFWVAFWKRYSEAPDLAAAWADALASVLNQLEVELER